MRYFFAHAAIIDASHFAAAISATLPLMPLMLPLRRR